MFTMVDEKFLNWVSQEMEKQGINQSQLAKKGGVSKQVINKLFNGGNGPTANNCSAIAKGLGIPEEEVFTRAGLMRPKPEPSDYLVEQLISLTNELLNQEDKQTLIDLATSLLERQGRSNDLSQYRQSLTNYSPASQRKK